MLIFSHFLGTTFYEISICVGHPDITMMARVSKFKDVVFEKKSALFPRVGSEPPPPPRLSKFLKIRGPPGGPLGTRNIGDLVN